VREFVLTSDLLARLAIALHPSTTPSGLFPAPDVDPASASAHLVSGRYFPCVASDAFDTREEGTLTCMSLAKMRKLRTQRTGSLHLAMIRVSALHSTWSMLCQPHLPIFGDACYLPWILQLCRMLRQPRQNRLQTLQNLVKP
jgi:hypothetical protein